MSAILVALGAVLWGSRLSIGQFPSPVATTSNAPAATTPNGMFLPPAPTTTASSSPAPLPTLEVVDRFTGGTWSFLGTTQYVDTSTRTEVSFVEDNGQAYRISAADIVVGGKQIGSIAGDWLRPMGFSPDGKYFAFGLYYYLGCCDIHSNIDVVSLSTTPMNIQSFLPFIQSAPYPSGGWQPPDMYNNPELLDKYIASGSWGDSGDSLDAISYYLWSGPSTTTGPTYYRVSPEETWRYDLTTESSTLIQTGQ